MIRIGEMNIKKQIDPNNTLSFKASKSWVKIFKIEGRKERIKRQTSFE